MRPKIKALPYVWYCDQPFGNNKVANCVKEMCKEAGIEGKFANHSLHATSASRMYQSLVPEQMIKEVTGHRSDCVRSYKRTNDDIRKVASNTISGANVNNVGLDVKETGQSKEKMSVKSEDKCELKLMQEQNKHLNESLSVCEMVKNVIRTCLELRKKKQFSKSKVIVARKLLNKQKRKEFVHGDKKNKVCVIRNRHAVVDLNVNVRFCK